MPKIIIEMSSEKYAEHVANIGIYRVARDQAKGSRDPNTKSMYKMLDTLVHNLEDILIKSVKKD